MLTWIEEYEIFECKIFGILEERKKMVCLENFDRLKIRTCHWSWRKSFTHWRYLSASFFTAGFWIKLMFNNWPLACENEVYIVVERYSMVLTLTIQLRQVSFGCWHCFQIKSMIRISIQAAFNNLIWLSI